MSKRYQPMTKKQIANAANLPLEHVRHEAELWGLQDTANMTKAEMVEYIQDSALMAEKGDL
jgi:hypothetical protein